MLLVKSLNSRNIMKDILLILKSLIFSSGFVICWGWVFFNVTYFDKYFSFQIPDWMEKIGIALIITGAVISISCILTFITKGSGTPAPFDPPVQFVATGPYKYTRNPMYIGGLIILIGAGLYMNS